MARRRFFTYSAKFSCNHLRLPFRVERNAENCFAVIAQK